MDNRSIRYSLSKPLPRSKEVLVPGLYLLDTVLQPLKLCSFWQRFSMFHSSRHLETGSCLSWFKSKKDRHVT